MTDTDMSEEEIETVARELAKVGGTSWYPGRPKGAVLRRVGDRYRDQARAVIQAYRRAHGDVAPESGGQASQGKRDAEGPRSDLRVGDIVVYRRDGELRAEPCRITQIENGRAYLTPVAPQAPGWVPLPDESPAVGSGKA
ncbi:hypothetical protein [Microvirga pudoricolor]|uniref:hypothetical protein n=1 Tax=Microvirga pudoricolor TaxID=2778729 RepID=UPI00194EA3C5|nr:hypothetical protein [Microvirga pudoricolor]MBM6596771.1 hypothetical protein [Microvirga pudoricolor]